MVHEEMQRIIALCLIQVTFSYFNFRRIFLHNKPKFNLFSSKLDDDFKHLQAEFVELTSAGDPDFASSTTVLAWSEIQALIADELLSTDEIMAILEKYTDASGKISFSDFISINSALDDVLDERDDVTDDEQILTDAQSMGFSTDSDCNDSGYEQEYLDIGSVNPWDMELDVQSVYDPPFLGYLRGFFSSHADEDGLAYDDFVEWKDIHDMLESGSVDVTCLKDVWLEAVEAKRAASSEADMPTPGTPQSSILEASKVDLDSFFRLCIRLDQLADEIEAALEALSDADVEAYYTSAFAEQSTDGTLLTYDEFANWSDIGLLVSEGLVSWQDIEAKWQALPKEADNGDGRRGIVLSTFIALMNAIDDDINTTSSNEI